MTVAVILAGGQGTRLRATVPDVPKALAPVGGYPFLHHLMGWWCAQGISKFILSVGYKSEQVKDFCSSSFNGVPVQFVEEEVPLGTGGAVMQARKYVDEAFVLLNGDTFFPVTLSQIEERRDTHRLNLLVCVFRANKDRQYGKVVFDDNGIITDFCSSKAQVGEWSNGGVYLVDPTSLDDLSLDLFAPFSFDTEVMPRLLAAGMTAKVVESSTIFLDIGTPEDYSRAESIIGFSTSQLNKNI